MVDRLHFWVILIWFEAIYSFSFVSPNVSSTFGAYGRKSNEIFIIYILLLVNDIYFFAECFLREL